MAQDGRCGRQLLRVVFDLGVGVSLLNFSAWYEQLNCPCCHKDRQVPQSRISLAYIGVASVWIIGVF